MPGTHVVLRDGSTADLRVVRPEDEAALAEFLIALSPDTRALRFFGAESPESLATRAREWAHTRADEGADLVAIAGGDGRIIGHGHYVPADDGKAEVAFVVADAWQGKGLGTAMLERLAALAAERGIHTFTATVLPQNSGMLRVFRDSGFFPTITPRAGEIEVAFPTEITEQGRERQDARVAAAAVNAVSRFLKARSVAVIGASRTRGTIGGEVFHNLLEYGFNGPVIPVNPSAGVVQSVLAYPRIEEVPEQVDLAVIAVPAASVVEVAEACGASGVRALVVISAGFAETGDQGRARQHELLAVCRRWGMRLIGPNCMGILTTDPAVRLNATFAPVPPPRGRVGFMSQSGALGLAVIDYAASLGLGLSSFISVGNKADISGNDLIQYWEADEETDVILLYLESFGNPRNFSRIARRVARSKPIVAVKSGRSTAGARATSSHTGALLAASDVTVDALFRQAGVIRTDTLSEMFNVATLVASQPPPKGRRVAILTNAGGPGILCADTCEAEGLEVPDLRPETREALAAILATEASVLNPVDMIASATPDQYRRAMEIIGRDPEVDALIVIFIPPLVTNPNEAAAAIVAGARALAGEKPVLTVFMRAEGVPPELRADDVRLPSYAFPEEAAIALSRVTRYGEWRARPVEAPVSFEDARREEAAAIVAAALGQGDQWLSPRDVWRLLNCYAIPVLDQRVVATAEEAGRAAAEMGVRVAIKGVAPGLVHKSDVGAVLLGLEPAEVEAAARGMAERLERIGTPLAGFVVQAMAEEGTEMIVGVVQDEHFGPVVACGAGGVLVEILKDVSLRMTPLTRRDAVEMVDELKTRPLLAGYRGSPPRDVEALVDIILRVGELVDDLPQIQELDLNPVLVHVQGATAVDARIRVG